MYRHFLKLPYTHLTEVAPFAKSGGLKGTVIPYNKFTGEGTGFSFYAYNARDMLNTLRMALELFADKSVWYKLVLNAMKLNFSWDESAKKYEELYKNLLG